MTQPAAHRPTQANPANSWLHRALTTAMLASFALAGWFFTSAPTTSTSFASVSKPTAKAAAKPERRYVTKNIEDIREGDLVLAREEHGTRLGYRRVAETYCRTSYHLRHLKFSAPDGSQQTLQTTDEHPFWNAKRGIWKAAGAFKVGDPVTTPDGHLQTLTATHRTEHPEGVPVFNFQVEQAHTYFVSAFPDHIPVLVHNADHVYRVMSPSEFAGASKGKWADAAFTETPGIKYTWADQGSAEKWADLMRKHGEEGIVTRIPVLKDTSKFQSWLHSSPIGQVFEVPLDMLGTATRAQ